MCKDSQEYMKKSVMTATGNEAQMLRRESRAYMQLAVRLALSRRCNMLDQSGWQPPDFEDCIAVQTPKRHCRPCKLRCQTQECCIVRLL